MANWFAEQTNVIAFEFKEGSNINIVYEILKLISQPWCNNGIKPVYVHIQHEKQR